MARRWSKYDAPYSRCNKCGWSGNDWAFKYQGLCSKCYKRWRKEKAEERKKLKIPNDNLEIAPGLIVTRNVKDRLSKQAYSDVPHTQIWHLAGTFELIGYLLSLAAMAVLMFSYNAHPNFAPFLVGFTVLGFVMAAISSRIQKVETDKWRPIVDARLEELARQRQMEIEEASAFYESSEWRLLRQKIIDQQGRICQECNCPIVEDYDLTVDHINPRSKFPDQSLDVTNLRVLCRSCNAKKGNRFPEELSDSDQQNTK